MSPRTPASSYPLLHAVDGTFVAVLDKAYAAHIQDALLDENSGQEVLDFNLPWGNDKIPFIKNEMTVNFGGSVFRVRLPASAFDQQGALSYAVHCEALWYDLQATDPRPAINVTTATAAMTAALSGTGWTVGTVNPSSSATFQTVAGISALSALRAIPAVFGGELQFDNVNKVVHLLTARGQQTGLLYARGKNATQDLISVDTTNMYTRVYPTGQNGIDISTVNAGGKYIEDYSYYDSIGAPHIIRATAIQNTALTTPAQVLSWGQGQLNLMRTPAITYQFAVTTLPGDVLPNLGDIVKVWDKVLGYQTSARIVARDIYPLEPAKSVLTINTAAATLTTGSSGPAPTSQPSPFTTGDTLSPANPTGVTLTANYSFTGQGTRQITVSASWNAVTTNSDGSPITDLDHYEVQYQTDSSGVWIPMGNTTSTSLMSPLLAVQSSIIARVAAVDHVGNRSAWVQTSGSVTADTLPPVQPTPLTLATGTFPLTVEASWDGQTINNHPMAQDSPDFAFLEVHFSTVNGFTPSTATLVDTIVGAVGGTAPVTSLTPGVTYYFTSVAVDRAGNRSPKSTQVSGTPTGLNTADIADSAITAAKVGFAVGGGNLMPNSSLEDGTITSFGTVGAVGGSAVNSTDIAFHGTHSFKMSAAGGVAAGPYYAGNGNIYVVPGQKYTFSVWVHPSADCHFHATIEWYDISSTQLGILYGNDTLCPANTWTRCLVSGTAPAGAAFPNLTCYSTVNPAVGTVLYYDAWQFEGGDVATAYAPKPDEILPNTIGTTMIQDNAITSPKVIAGAIVAGKIAAGAVTVDTLTVGSTSTNNVRNSTMEDVDATSGLPKVWTTGYEVAGSGGTVSAGAGIAGTTSLQIAATAADGQAVASAAIPVTPGDQYDVSAWMKQSATGHIYLRALFGTADGFARGATIAGSVAVPADVGVYDSTGALVANPTGVGSTGYADVVAGYSLPANNAAYRVAGRVTVPAGATWMRIAVYGWNGGVATYNFDNVEARRVVGTASIMNAAIVNAKIADLAVNNAKIADLAVSKLTAGTLSADVAIAARIKTANTGARVELNASGLFAYDAGSTNTVAIRNDGSASFQGTITATGGSITGNLTVSAALTMSSGGVLRTAPSGSARVEISTVTLPLAGGGVGEMVRFFTGDAAEGASGSSWPQGIVVAGVNGSGGTRQGVIEMVSPQLQSSGTMGVAEIVIYGGSADNTINPSILISGNAGGTTIGGTGGLTVSNGPTTLSGGGLTVTYNGQFNSSLTVSATLTASGGTFNLSDGQMTKSPGVGFALNSSLQLAGALMPSADFTYDLGSSGVRWRYLQSNSAFMYGMGSAAGTTVVVTSGGGLAKSSSSRRYKTRIKPAEVRHDILDLKPVTYHMKADVADGYGDPFMREVGLIAEDVHAAGFSDLVYYEVPQTIVDEKDGRPVYERTGEPERPESVQYERIGVMLLPIVKDLRDRVAALEGRSGDVSTS